jgi:chromosome segregation protein
MQLKHIKLSGFKSFVDPTKISFPSNLVGVVGPNGCGKSNVIDAVRWVLGELSAKNLRGESMVDVIFNGSEKRKPSGQCSIELLFDNSSGKIGGEYASYNEISIKRVMTRDAQSTYFINSTKCRRKDVQDIFLGTGLGPSSYAIIEQGMVSKLVSAKPEELRTHIEEAAGVSKYRERRRETESRIKKTKENLSRVKDIKDEIERLIRRLENQASAAEKYNQLKEEENQKQTDIAILYSLEAKNNKEKLQKNLDALNRDFKIKQAESDSKQAQIDDYRTQNESVINAYESAQKNFYTIGAEIAKHESDLHNINKSEATNLEALERAQKSYQDALEKESVFKDLSPKEKELKLNIAIVKAFDALEKKNTIGKAIQPLEDQINIKQGELDSKQDIFDGIKANKDKVVSEIKGLQDDQFSIEAEIARTEGSIKNLNNLEENAHSDFKEASRNYVNAVEKESNNDHLNPKEKAMHLLDTISELLKSFGSNVDKVNSKLSELKELLMSILKIASDQSKSFTAEYLNQKNRAEETINKTKSDKKDAENKLQDLNNQKIAINKQIDSQASIQANIDTQLNEMDSNKSIVSNELRSLEKQINDLRLELRTHEVNLENASNVLEKAEVSISDFDPNQYKGMDLKGLEESLDEIQKNIAQLGSVNLASPEEYLNRKN